MLAYQWRAARPDRSVWPSNGAFLVRRSSRLRGVLQHVKRRLCIPWWTAVRLICSRTSLSV